MIWSLGCKPYSTLTDVEQVCLYCIDGGCILSKHSLLSFAKIATHVFSQVLHKLGKGFRLSPPPGSPRSIYKLMVDCWYVSQFVYTIKYLDTLQAPNP